MTRKEKTNLRLLKILIQTQVNAPDPFHLAFGRETLVKTFGAKLPGQFRPRPHGADERSGVPAFLPNLDKFAVSIKSPNTRRAL